MFHCLKSTAKFLTPYLFLTSILYPQSAIPVIETLLDTTFFKVAVFPGFTYATYCRSNNIYRAQVPCQDATQGWPTLCRQDRGYTTAVGRWPEASIQRNNHSLRIRQTDLLVGSYSFCRNCCAVVALIPRSAGWVVADIDVGLLAVFAILGFFPLIALLFSWASNSKYPFIGGLRALHQLIAFEIPFILSALSVVILSGTLNLTEVVESQIQSYWFIFFLPISAFVFYISSF